MDRIEYEAALKAMHDAPLASTATPSGQAFHVGQRVRFVTDGYRMWGAPAGTEGEIQYSYLQKYGHPGSEDAARQMNQYSVKFPGNTLAWVYASELEAMPDTPPANEIR